MDSVKERLTHCILRRTLKVSPEIRGGSCQRTKASPGRGNVTSEGLSCHVSGFCMVPGGGWGKQGGWRGRQEYGLL